MLNYLLRLVVNSDVNTTFKDIRVFDRCFDVVAVTFNRLVLIYFLSLKSILELFIDS